MKNIKFKVLIMFMLLVLVGLGSSSVFAEEIEVIRVKAIYSNDIGNMGYHFMLPEGMSKYINNNDLAKLNFFNRVRNKTFEWKGELYIRYDDWVLFMEDHYFLNSMQMAWAEETLATMFSEDIKLAQLQYINEKNNTTVSFRDALKEKYKSSYDNLGPVITSILTDMSYDLSVLKVVEASGMNKDRITRHIKCFDR